MPSIRVLIIDGSVMIRRHLSESLMGDADFEVVGTASSGTIGLAKLTQVSPDMVVLDADLPDMDGVETLRAIRRSHPRLPVILLCGATEQRLARAREAIAAGANRCVVKPDAAGGTAATIQRLHDDLAPKIKALCADICDSAAATIDLERATADLESMQDAVYWPAGDGGAGPAGTGSLDASATLRTPAAWVPSPASHDRVQTPAQATSRSAAVRRASIARPTGVLAIGVSTGGPSALTNVLSELPASFTLPVVIAQHMPPMFTKLLAHRLSMRCPLPVREAQGGEALLPGEAWIAPGDHHLVVAPGPDGLTVQLNQDPPENCCRPSVDVLFRSVAGACGQDSIAVVLTGMGHDGLNGCRWIKERHGRVIAQDEATSVVWGMPGSVARAGIADRVLPIQLIASEVLRMTDRGVGARIARVVGAKP